MGLYLSKPLTNKTGEHTDDGNVLSVGVAEMQGWRQWMEDAHINFISTDNRYHLLGVFDGHGGPAVAKWVALKFKKYFEEVMPTTQKENLRLEPEIAKKVDPNYLQLAHALDNTIMSIDDALIGTGQENQILSGGLNEDQKEILFELEAIHKTCEAIKNHDLKRFGQGYSSDCYYTSWFNGRKMEIKELPDGTRTIVDVGSDHDSDDNASNGNEDNNDNAFECTYEHFDLIYQKIRADRDEKRGNPLFQGDEEKMLITGNYHPRLCGCASVVAGILNNKENSCVVSANSGDSRCLIIRQGKAVPMTKDHKPSQKRELERIEEAGGRVSNGRIQGNLNLSRTLGDTTYKVTPGICAKKQMITAAPDVTFMQLCKEDDFVVLACDGIWDCLTCDELAERVDAKWKQLDAERTEPRTDIGDAAICRKIAEYLCDECVATSPFENVSTGGLGCDNMTVVVARIKDEFKKDLLPYSELNLSEVTFYGNSDETKAYNEIEVAQ